MKKLFFIIIVLIFFINNVAFATPRNTFKIDASKNAINHNNLGVNYLERKDYYSAIKEFEIAILINPDTQASATYYNNLGKTYIKTKNPQTISPKTTTFSLNFIFLLGTIAIKNPP